MDWANFMGVRLAMLMGLTGMALGLPLRAAELTLPERYLHMYIGINEAEQAEHAQDFKSALEGFEDCYRQLLDIQKADPDWEEALVLHRLQDLKAKILEMEGRVNPPAANAAPAAPGGLATNRVPIAPMPPMQFAETASRRSHNIYPWKTNIPAAKFWIGEGGVPSSAWDGNWVRDNDGPDSPTNRNGYASGSHASGLNPFYVALPFNDLAHPDLAQKWLPHGWARAPKNGAPVSACKDRWLELKNARGDVCYAQWEDVGPRRNDHAAYVFGDEVPGKDEPGICVSPAVAEYLQVIGAPALVSWRFVDNADVRPGAWLKMDEQAVLYRALHHLQASR
jgi:hypothetical protein